MKSDFINSFLLRIVLLVSFLKTHCLPPDVKILLLLFVVVSLGFFPRKFLMFVLMSQSIINLIKIILKCGVKREG